MKALKPLLPLVEDNVGGGRGGVAAVDGSPQVAEPRGGGACERAVKEDVGGVGDGGREFDPSL